MKAHHIVVGCALFALMAGPITAQHAQEQVVDNPFGHESDRTSHATGDDQEHSHPSSDGPSHDPFGGGSSNDPFGAERIIVRTYDISDLIVTPGSYPAKQESELMRESSLAFPPVQSPPTSESHAIIGGFGGMGGGMGGMGGGAGTQGGGFFQVPDSVSVSQTGILGQAGSGGMAAPPVTVAPKWAAAIDELISAITAVIEPESWDQVGGPGSIAVVGQTLVIGQTVSIHDQIAMFLQELRQNREDRPTLTVQIDWLWQTPEQHARWLQQASGDKPSGSVSVDQWRAWKSTAADGPHFTAAIRCFNSQTVHVQTGEQQLQVTGMTAVVGSETGYQPQVSLAQEGAVVQVTPILQSQNNQVVIDFHSRVTVRKPSDSPAQAAGATMGNVPMQAAAAIDRPVLLVQRLSTTTRLPLNQVTLVGGMTFSPEHDQSDLYIFVLVTRP